MDITATVRVNNVSDYADAYDYLIARCVNGEVWYYGATNDEAVADRIAREVDGFVLKWR